MWLRFAVLLLPFAAALTPCYFPNGLAEANLNPCNASAEVSACCAPTDICITNGLCLNLNQSMEANNTNYWRDGCTDANFGPGCPQYCTSTAIDEAAYTGNVLVKYCGDSSPGTSTFCCIAQGGNSDCCQNQTEIFEADSITRYASIASVLSTSTSSLSTATASSTSSTSATATPSSASASGGLSSGAEAGIIVGAIIAAIVVIGGIVAALWFRRKRRNTTPMAESYAEVSPDEMPKPSPSGQYYMDEQAPTMAKVELPGEGLQEMPAPWKPNELPGSGNKTTAYELPASE